MVPDDWIWVGIVASVLALLSLQPIVYRFLAEQLWPFGVTFTFYQQIAQAGSGVLLNIRIRNRTTEPTYFQIGARYTEDPASDVRPFRFINMKTTRHFPLNEPFAGTLPLQPLEVDSIVVRLTPTVRGRYQFIVEITEFNHHSRFPRWVTFQRRVLKWKNPNLHLLEFAKEINFNATTWMISPDGLKNVIGRDRTTEEVSLDADYGRHMDELSRVPPAGGAS